MKHKHKIFQYLTAAGLALAALAVLAGLIIAIIPAATPSQLQEFENWKKLEEAQG